MRYACAPPHSVVCKLPTARTYVNFVDQFYGHLEKIIPLQPLFIESLLTAIYTRQIWICFALRGSEISKKSQRNCESWEWRETYPGWWEPKGRHHRGIRQRGWRCTSQWRWRQPSNTNGSTGRFSKIQRQVSINASEAERQHVVSYAIDELYATSHSTACLKPETTWLTQTMKQITKLLHLRMRTATRFSKT